jgi:hypothetical protein
MDVKALNAKRYGEICGIDERFAERTVENIKEDLPKDIDWIIQQGNDERVPPNFNLTPLSDDEVKDIAKILLKDRKNVWIRTRAGDERIS